MSFKFFDRVRETSVTTGSGDMQLAGAVSNFQAVGSLLSDGDISMFTYVLGAAYETSYCRYNSGANSLTRLVVLESSNAGALVTFASGTKDVIMNLPASITEYMLNNQRRNILLSSAALAKATGIAAYQRGDKFFADGYFGSDGIKAASSSFYAVDATNKKVAPTGPIDAATSLLIHADGTNGGTAFTDASNYANTVTTGGAATTSTTQKKFGTASLLTSTGYLSAAWNSAMAPNGGFCLDWWGYNQNGILFTMDNDGTYGPFFITAGTGSVIYSSANNAGWGVLSAASTNFTSPSNAWTHYEIDYVSATGNWYCFQNGVLMATLSSSGAPFFAGWPLKINRGQAATGGNTGYLDEIRFSNVPRHTSGFTPPANPYGTSDNMVPVPAPKFRTQHLSAGALLLNFSRVDSFTLNTDITAELSADNESNYIAGTLRQIGTLTKGAGTASYLLETDYIDLSAHTGTAGILARIKTLNNKNGSILRTMKSWEN